DHPLLERWHEQASAGEARVKEARRARAPGCVVGVDWIEVGPARMSGVADSGKDAVMVSVGVDLRFGSATMPKINEPPRPTPPRPGPSGPPPTIVRPRSSASRSRPSAIRLGARACTRPR